MSSALPEACLATIVGVDDYFAGNFDTDMDCLRKNVGIGTAGNDFKPSAGIPRCRFCRSSVGMRYDTFRGVQRYFCKTCQRKYADNGALLTMRTPVEQVACAISYVL